MSAAVSPGEPVSPGELVSRGEAATGGSVGRPTEGSWATGPRPVPACADDPHSGPGRLDEADRRLSHSELAVAQQLAGEGHHVRSLPERPGQGPVSDLMVCGEPVEVKSWLPLDDRQGRAPSAKSVCNKLRSARDQAPTIVLYGRGSGLTPEATRAGVDLFAGEGRCGSVAVVRALGDGFDLSWSRDPGRELGGGVPVPAGPRPDRPHRPSRRAESPGLGLGR